MNNEEKLLKLINIVRLRPVQERVLVNTEIARAEVFDIEVSNTHDFYANNILVHNCRYALISRAKPRVVPNKPDRTSTEYLMEAIKKQSRKEKLSKW